MKKKIVSALMVAAMVVTAFAGCGSDKGGTSTQGGDKTSKSSGKVYMLNFKPETDEAWQNLAKKYTEETGDANISTFQFKTQDGNANGYAADWHPTAKTHDIAAAELTEYIKSLM